VKYNRSRSLKMGVMYNVLSGLAACGRLGSSGATGVFVWHATGSTRRTLARRQQTESVECQ